MEDPQPDDKDIIQRLTEKLEIPGIPSLVLAAFFFGALIGVIGIYLILNSIGGLPVNIDCKTAIQVCEAFPAP